MRGSKFQNPDITAAFHQQRIYEMHQKKLEQINKQGGALQTQKQINLQQIPPGGGSPQNLGANPLQNIFNSSNDMPSKFLTSRIQAQEHKEIEKLTQIKYENEILLKKLVDISQGKQISVGKHVIQEVVKKPKTLHLDKKRHDAERIDHDNIRLLQKITKVSSTIPKIKLDKDWSLHKSYKRIVEKSGRKDLNDLFSRRKEFLEKNFQGMLPGIVKDSSRSREDVYSKNNGVLSDSKYSINILLV